MSSATPPRTRRSMTAAAGSSTVAAAAVPPRASRRPAAKDPDLPSTNRSPALDKGTTASTSSATTGGMDTRTRRCSQCGRRPPCTHQTGLHPRRDKKLKHREAVAAAAATATGQPPISLTPGNTNSSAAAPPTKPLSGSDSASSGISSSSGNSRNNQFFGGTNNTDMDPPVLSFYGTEPVPLPSRFARIKRNLIAGHEAALEASWGRLIEALRSEVDHIEGLGPHLIPSIEFSDIGDAAQTSRFGRDLKRYGVGVVRGVVPPTECDDFVRETVGYLETAQNFKPPSPQDPTCFDFYWTPAQLRSRAHPHVVRAQRFMMGLWESTPDDKIATRFPIAYADRIRIHGSNIQSLQPSDADVDVAEPPPTHNGDRPLASADDWLSQIASSTVIAQIDNGSLERWEPDGYQRGGTYDRVFHGDWDSYDPWECAGRVLASPDLYNGYGACSIVRLYQGLLALNTIEPGTIRLLPSPKLATAYFLLRPFFSPRRPPPEVREGPEWEAFLSPANWAIDREQSTIVHGAVPGHAQRVTELWHPHLHLRRSLITLPTLQAGDYILWHPDLAYHITSNGGGNPAGLPAASSTSANSVSLVPYLPACPLTQNNALYLARQRKAFLRGHPGPDFDDTGSGLGSEAPHTGRLGEKEIAETGGPAGLQGMGLAPWDQAATPTNGNGGGNGEGSAPPSATAADGEKKSGADDDVVMADASDVAGGETRSLHSAASNSHAEAEVVRVANLILFPDRFMMGFPQERKKRTAAEKERERAGAAKVVDGIRNASSSVVHNHATASRPLRAEAA